MSDDFVPNEERFDPDGNPIRGRIFIRSAHYTNIGRGDSSLTVVLHISGPERMNDSFESEYYAIVFNNPVHVDIRTHEDAFTSDYTNKDTGQFMWERGSLVIEGVSGFESFTCGRFLERFSDQESIHTPFKGRYNEASGISLKDFRLVDDIQAIHILTTETPVITPPVKAYAER